MYDEERPCSCRSIRLRAARAARAGVGSFAQGSNATLTATPNDGYTILVCDSVSNDASG